MAADWIVCARRIYTMCRRSPVVEAMAIVGDRVVATGTRARIRSWRGRRTQVLDAGRFVVVPGLTDCHAHPFAWAVTMDEASLAGVSSLDAALRTIARAVGHLGPGEWLIGNGFDKNTCGREFPTAARLDAVTGLQVPACIRSRDGHSAWVNTCALRRRNITADTPDPPGGRILRDHRGRPTGTLLDKAVELLGNPSGAATESRVRRLWRRVCREAYSYGLTTLHSVDDIEAFAWFQRLRQENRLGLRIRYAIPLANLGAARELGVRGGLGDDQLRVAGVKIYADGSLGSQTAWMYRAYPGQPGYHGVAVCVGDELRDAVGSAASAGLPCWVHAIGDRGVHEVATALVRAGAPPAGQPRLLHRIEHAQCVRPRTVGIMAEGGLIASVQPVHIPGDMATADNYWPEVCQYAYPLRSLQRAGVLMAFGSDVPVETLNPFAGIWAAVQRVDRSGQPPDGWHPAERIDRRTALAGYTTAAARSVGEADRFGRLDCGRYADFAVLNDDPLLCDPGELPAIRSVCTVLGGRCVMSVASLSLEPSM